MKPFLLAAALLAAAACGPKSAPNTAGDGSGVAVVAKRVQLSWGIAPGQGTSDVYLQTTDETGSQVSHPLGTFPGQCVEQPAAPGANALITAVCKDGATGLELDVRADHAGQQVVVMKLRVDQGVAPDPMSGEEVLRFPVAPGAAIEAHH